MRSEDRQAAIELLTAVEDYVIAFVVTLLERRGGFPLTPVKTEVRERVIDAIAEIARRVDP
jgi:hypothetical protein